MKKFIGLCLLLLLTACAGVQTSDILEDTTVGKARGIIDIDIDNNTAVDVVYGGTNATTESTARTNLGLAIGSNVQAYDADLSSLASGITGIVKGLGNGSGFSAATGGTDYLRPTTDVDDTPVDSETTQPISSNWAYDHANAADPHAGYMLESNIGTGANNYLKLGSSPGTPDGTKVLRDDMTWAAGGAGDVTAVGDCSDGLCLDGSSDGGSYIRLYDGDSNYTQLSPGNSSTDLTFTFPTAAAGGDNYLLNFDANGTGGFTNPASFLATASLGTGVETALGQQTNTTSGFPTGSGSATLTNKTIDADDNVLQDMPKDIHISFDPGDGSFDLHIKLQRAYTLSSIGCFVDPADTSESIDLDVYECDSNGDNCVASLSATITCANTPTAGTISDGAFDSGDVLKFTFGAPTGTVSNTTVYGTGKESW